MGYNQPQYGHHPGSSDYTPKPTITIMLGLEFLHFIVTVSTCMNIVGRD